MSDTKVLESTALIRFPDCDPFNHLNNARYLDYFINAREDQVWKAYDLNIYHMAREVGRSWVVGSNQIAYLKPAFLMETVVMQSQLIGFSESDLQVEMRMYDQAKKVLKSVLWSRFVHVNVATQKRDTHSDELMELFTSAHNPVAEKSFEMRVGALREAMKAAAQP